MPAILNLCFPGERPVYPLGEEQFGSLCGLGPSSTQTALAPSNPNVALVLVVLDGG